MTGPVLIERIEAIPIEVPVRRPLRMAVASVNARTCIVVRITTDDGVVGLGESVLARYFSGESPASAVDVIDTALTPALVGRDAGELTAIHHLMRRITVHNNGARAAVEMALHDIVATAAGIPLHRFYGGKARPSVPAIWHVSGRAPEAMAEEAGRAVEDGFEIIKVKVGNDVDHDLAVTYAVREAIGPEVLLLPDANQGWDVGDALRYLDGVAEARPGFVEQPLPRSDMPGMAELVARSRVRVAVDEAVFDAADLRAYLAARAVGAVVAKLMKAAGPIGVRDVFAVAGAAGLGVHLAGMAGQTGISAAHGAHLAIAVPELRFGSGLSPHYLADDVCAEPFVPDKGHLHPGDGPGLGVALDEEKLARYRLDR